MRKLFRFAVYLMAVVGVILTTLIIIGAVVGPQDEVVIRLVLDEEAVERINDAVPVEQGKVLSELAAEVAASNPELAEQ